MKVPIKDPKFAYITNYLWLPKACISEDQLNKDLRFVVSERGGIRAVIHTLWHDCGSHYRVPRQYPVPDGVQVIDLRPTRFEPLHIESTVTSFLDDRQQRAWEALKGAKEGILKLSCGGGKTVLALKKAIENNGPVIVIFNDTGLMGQWETEVRKHTTYTGPIGIIQRGICDWTKPIVFASIRTLINRRQLPVEARTRFKTVIFDEAHHCPASVLKQVLGIFWGDRICLTATPERADMMERLLYLHAGPIFFEDTTPPMKPRVYFKRTPVKISMWSPKVRGYGGDLNYQGVIDALSHDDVRNQIIIDEVEKARRHGRKILVITNLLSHVKLLTDKIPGAHSLTGRDPQNVRHLIFKKYQVVVAIRQVGQEGLDAKDLDTVIFAFPTKRKATFDQIAGRALRAMEGKNIPVIVILDDVEVPPMFHICKSLRRQLDIEGVDYSII